MNNGFGDICDTCEVHKEKTECIKGCMLDESNAKKLAEIFKVLGDPTRIKILYVLSRTEMCVCDIADVLDMTQSAISHQLRLLRAMKLVKYRRDGKSAIYSLDDDHILQLFNQGMEHIQHS